MVRNIVKVLGKLSAEAPVAVHGQRDESCPITFALGIIFGVFGILAIVEIGQGVGQRFGDLRWSQRVTNGNIREIHAAIIIKQFAVRDFCGVILTVGVHLCQGHRIYTSLVLIDSLSIDYSLMPAVASLPALLVEATRLRVGRVRIGGCVVVSTKAFSNPRVGWKVPRVPVGKDGFFVGGGQVIVVGLRGPGEGVEENMGAIVDLSQISGSSSYRRKRDDMLQSSGGQVYRHQMLDAVLFTSVHFAVEAS